MAAYKRLVKSLDQLVRVYRHLLEAVRREQEILIRADLEALAEVNFAKEKLVFKVKSLDRQWQDAADDLAKELDIKQESPRLLDLAAHFQGDESTKLEQLHSVLHMLVGRIQDINRDNQQLTESALAHISGAMGSITQTLNENPTYRNSGSLEESNKDAQGRLVRRQV